MENVKEEKVVLQIVDMHCASCAINIDFELEDLEGVREAKTSYVKQKLEVVFLPKKVSVEKIIKTIAKLGYKAVVKK